MRFLPGNRIVWLLLTFLPHFVFSQNARQYFRTGISFAENGNYTDAVDHFTRALEIDPQYVQAYIERARSYEASGELQKAVDDLKRAVTFDQKDPTVFYKMAQLQFDLSQYEDALEYINKCISRDRKSDAAHLLLARIQMVMEDYSSSLEAINRALQLKENADNFYFRGQLSEIMKNNAQAEFDYKMAITRDQNFADAYLALAMLKLRSGKPEEAITNCNAVLRLDQDNRDALILRSRALAKLTRYHEAIDDISKILCQNPDDKEMYFTRGQYYQDFTQHQSAINDFSKVLLIDPTFSEALFRRALSYEQTGNFESAVRDYEKITELSTDDASARLHLDNARQRLFELRRESDPPGFSIVEPVMKNDSTIEIPVNIRSLKLLGTIRDESDIAEVLVNRKPASFYRTGEYYEFTAKPDISVSDMITVEVRDVYDNIRTTTYNLVRTETDAPEISILKPYASDNLEIYLDTDNPDLFIEGKITDQSKIQSILIDGITASFAIDELNPTFHAVLNIANKNRFSVTAKDIYGNDTTFLYVINRAGISMLEANPMGRTWIVFIGNSNYENFASLEGPSRDIALVRSSLSGYDIHKVIHKQDMTKKEMERFFSIELRDLLRDNQVNSLMIWYAGHGKFFNETGYWIPVDARRDDEFSYYNLNALRASLLSYSNNVTHCLVISDACESGATFNQVMRNATEEKSCGDWEAVKLKSSQVFTSAGYEVAADQSQFTKTFASVLSGNSNACLPIETIVDKVTEAVMQSGNQTPRFGKIKGMEDEGGTFFFVSKN